MTRCGGLDRREQRGLGRAPRTASSDRRLDRPAAGAPGPTASATSSSRCVAWAPASTPPAATTTAPVPRKTRRLITTEGYRPMAVEPANWREVSALPPILVGGRRGCCTRQPDGARVSVGGSHVRYAWSSLTMARTVPTTEDGGRAMTDRLESLVETTACLRSGSTWRPSSSRSAGKQARPAHRSRPRRRCRHRQHHRRHPCALGGPRRLRRDGRRSPTRSRSPPAASTVRSRCRATGVATQGRLVRVRLADDDASIDGRIGASDDTGVELTVKTDDDPLHRTTRSSTALVQIELNRKDA